MSCQPVKRVKLVRLTPEPKLATLGIAAPAGPLSAAAEKFWQCAKDAALKPHDRCHLGARLT